eukprot:2928762-Pleurochrysis_carterae.AAC.3
MQAYMRTHTCTRPDAHAQMRTHSWARAHAHAHAQAHVRTRTCARTCRGTHAPHTTAYAYTDTGRDRGRRKSARVRARTHARPKPSDIHPSLATQRSVRTTLFLSRAIKNPVGYRDVLPRVSCAPRRPALLEKA